MLNPDFVMQHQKRRIQTMIKPLVEGGTDAKRTQALDALAERYASGCSNVSRVPTKRSPLYKWLSGFDSSPNLRVQRIVQRDYLLALDPESETLVAAMGNNLSTNLWVEVAARKLAQYAKERILDEIKAHYRDAFEEEIRNGHKSIAAHREALKRLGNPKAAGKVFRKTYLSIAEERRFTRFLHPESVRGYELLVWLFVCIWLVSILVSGPFSLGTLAYAALTLLSFIGRFIVPPLVRARNGRRAFVWQIASFLLMLPIFLGYYFSGYELLLHPALLGFAVGASVAFMSVITYLYSFLIRKQLPESQSDLGGPPTSS